MIFTDLLATRISYASVGNAPALLTNSQIAQGRPSCKWIKALLPIYQRLLAVFLELLSPAEIDIVVDYCWVELHADDL